MGSNSNVLSFHTKKKINFELPKPSASFPPVVCRSPAVLKLEEGTRDGKLAQFYLSLADKDDKFLVVFAFIKLGLLEVRR